MKEFEFYSVDNKKFSNKIEAIQYASLNKKQVTWHYQDEYFSKFDYSINSNSSIEEEYLKRAIEIREKYDYLILFFSGGSDSQNILDVFINNNIKLDEIVVSYPESGLKNFELSSSNISAENNVSEFKYTILPVIENLKKNNIDIRITIHDYYHDMLNYSSMDWLYRSLDWIHPATYAKFNLSKYEHINLKLKNNKIAVIYGVEKPILYEKNNKVFYLLTDVAVNGAIKSVDHTNCFIERFYLTPEIILKQSHCILNKSNIVNIEELKKINISEYQNSFIPFIYPNLKKINFQTKKASKRFMVESDFWFYCLHKDSSLYKMIENDFNIFLKSIDKKFLSEKGFVSFFKTFMIT